MGKLTDILNEDNGKKKESKYSQLLKDPRWQKKRLEILDRDDWKCTHCEAEHKTLHVHHRHKYVRGKKPWDYGNEELQTLCEDCHGMLKGLRPGIVQLLGKEGGWSNDETCPKCGEDGVINYEDCSVCTNDGCCVSFNFSPGSFGVSETNIPCCGDCKKRTRNECGKCDGFVCRSCWARHNCKKRPDLNEIIKHRHGGEYLLICPICGFDCVHVIGVSTEINMGGGVDRVSLRVECENNCTSEIEIAQHKGNEFVRVSEFDRSREVWIF